MESYLARLADPLIEELLGALPALALVGPRAAGKTTTAARHARTVIRLDRPAEAGVAAADPDAAIYGREEPVLLDEWQEVPEMLGAVKRACDRDSRPGRFILTGSVRAQTDHRTWPGTGRVTRVEMFPLTVGELTGATVPALVDRVCEGDPTLAIPAERATPGSLGIASAGEAPDLRDYVRLAVRGGFPQAAMGASERARRRWLETYITEIVGRDAALAGNGVDTGRLHRYFLAYAHQCARIVDDAGLHTAAGIDRRTALAYLDLLERIYAVTELPAWSSNRTKRLVKRPKRFLVDSSMLAEATGTTEASAMRDADLLGRLLETFVVAQLRAQATVSERRCALHHLRQHNGRHEIDVIAELDSGHIIGIEVKATAAPSIRDARHLAWLRDEEGDRFVAGLVLHTGPGVIPLGDRLSAVPISALWQ
ncbi:MAG: ATP-binding protein [Acidimicrobiaceae bacterium]|nr:ATP-binding protein [Acidimicrobiaceae bacterium]MXZ99809.1 ATP-binding protein [Acidimicrobiaceae bacterium]MYE76434.1 ATP-binding protein [Acidimicrobiaceae bacterium]MYE95903.1 ATP-binding protein [Acidimicrobiaceae bacterium]MYH44976.1 ATP-binding protein [Acidimicrobiaceae bacterium]